MTFSSHDGGVAFTELDSSMPRSPFGHCAVIVADKMMVFGGVENNTKADMYSKKDECVAYT